MGSDVLAVFPSIVMLAFVVALVSAGLLYIMLQTRMQDGIRALEAGTVRLMSGDFGFQIPAVSSESELGGLVLRMNKAMECMENELVTRQVLDDVRFELLSQDRRSLAHEMHGSTAQVLGFVKNKAFAARMLVEQNKSPEAVEELRQLEESVVAVFQDLRQTIRLLKETDHQVLPDFRSLLTGYLVWFEANYKISVDLNDDAPDRIQFSMEKTRHLMRIIQEALTNTVRHANTRRAAIDLRRKGERLEVIVSDEGGGFDAAQKIRSEHCLGLRVMREHAIQINASFEIRSSPGKGTQIVLGIPLVGGDRS